MNQLRRLRKNKDKILSQKNKAKKTLFKIAFISINLIFTTFAWFAYTRILQNDVDLNVSAWKMDFKSNNETLENIVQFQAENLYPGMTDYIKDIEISNLGDKRASVSCEIMDLKILGTAYEIKDTREEGDSSNTVYKKETTENDVSTIKVLNDQTRFPFEIIIKYDQKIYSQEDSLDKSKGNFQIRATWPYEIAGAEGIDEERNNLDTTWGYNVANFYKNATEGEQKHGIEVTLKVIAKQILD